MSSAERGGVNQDILSGQLDELISILARSHQLWVTLAGQEPAQLPESLLQTVLTASALLLGQTRDPDTSWSQPCATSAVAGSGTVFALGRDRGG